MLLCVAEQSPVTTGGLDRSLLRYGVFLLVGAAGAVLCSCRATFTSRECWVGCDARHFTGIGLRTD